MGCKMTDDELREQVAIALFTGILFGGNRDEWDQMSDNPDMFPPSYCKNWYRCGAEDVMGIVRQAQASALRTIASELTKLSRDAYNERGENDATDDYWRGAMDATDNLLARIVLRAERIEEGNAK